MKSCVGSLVFACHKLGTGRRWEHVLTSLFEQLKERKVVQWALAYLAGSWVALEVLGFVSDNFGWPSVVIRSLIVAVAVGLPITLVLAWYHGEQGRQRMGSGELLILAILLAGGGVALRVFGPGDVEATSAEAGGVASVDVRITEIDDRPAIAVLPFDNLSPDPEHAFFADGLAEDLIARLSSWRAFPVIARNSSFQFRGGNVDLQRVSEELGARYIVEGSVRRVGDRIRVTVQLIDAPSGEHVWADTYDDEVIDVFVVQGEISAMIAAPLVGDLRRAEARKARQRGTEDLEAWSLYQLALQHAFRFTREDFVAARRLFALSSERDPDFATPLAQLALANLWEVVLGWNETPDETISATLDLARRAASLDPRDPATQAALGWAYIMVGELQNGLDATKRAVELNPSMPDAWGWFSWAKLLAEESISCIDAAKRTQRLDPQGFYASLVYDNLSQCYWQEGRYDEGLEAAHRLLAELPDYFLGHVFVAMNSVPLGHLEEARNAIAAARSMQPDLSLDLVQGMYGVARPEIDARRNAILRHVGLE